MLLYALCIMFLFCNAQASDIDPISYSSSASANSSYDFEPLAAKSQASTRTWSSQDELEENIPPLQPTPPLQPKVSQRPQLTPSTQPASPNIVQSPTYSQASPVEPGTIPATPVMPQPRSMKVYNPEGDRQSAELRAEQQEAKDKIFFAEKNARIKDLLDSNLTADQANRAFQRASANQEVPASSYLLDNVFMNLSSPKDKITHTDTNIDIMPRSVNDLKRKVLESQSDTIGSQLSDLRSIPSTPHIKNRIRKLLEELKFIHRKLSEHHDMLAKKTLLTIADLNTNLSNRKFALKKAIIEHDLKKASIALDYHLAQENMHDKIIHDLDNELSSLK